MDEKYSAPYSPHCSKSNKNTRDHANHQRENLWIGTLVDDYNFLMSEELICRCKSSLGEPFTSLNDLSVHHVSHNEFEKQFGELADWCEKIYQTITKLPSNALTRYLRQKYYEELYEQGLMRLRMFDQYADKLIERFPDLKFNIHDKLIRINDLWNALESRFIDYLDEDFDRILQDLHNELFLFEEWLNQTEEQLWTFQFIRNDDISLKDLQSKLDQYTKLQDEIKSRNSRVSSIIEICERLRNDYEHQSEQIPVDLASDLENRWHQTWLNSVEIQCKLEERLKFFKNTTPLNLIEKKKEDTEDDDDIIPFNSSEYEKIPLTPSNSSLDSLNSPRTNHQRTHSTLIFKQIPSGQTKSFYLKRQMARSKRRMSLNCLTMNSPSTFYYSLTNINDLDENIISKKSKRTLSKLDVGYESEDENNHSSKHLRPIVQIRKSQSDFLVGKQINHQKNLFISRTHSLPAFEQQHHLPTWWRQSITSAYDTCSNPDIDLSLEETKTSHAKTSLLMYSKKYTKFNRKLSLSQQQSLSPPSTENHKPKKIPSNPPSNSYDASAEYTDPEQSENDVDILSSDFNSTSPVHRYPHPESQFYNRYTTTTTTTTTGYSSDVELETTTTPSETEDQQTPHLGELTQTKIDTFNLPSLVNSNGYDSLNTIILTKKFESSEPCWDGYQNPLFYPLNSHDMDSIETTLKWEDQFLEMDQPNNSSSDDEIHYNENFNHFIRNIDGSTSSLTRPVTGLGTNSQVFDSDSDLDDFNYVVNETERQLNKARQSLEKKKRQQPLAINDRNLRKYDEVLRTCETNIQCLQQILKNLHRSKNSRLNSSKAIEQLQTFLTGWHDMRQQVNDDRIRARQLLHISQGIIKLKLRLDEELARFTSTYPHAHPWLDESSLTELHRRIYYEIESEKESRQKLASYRADILLAEEHLTEYRMSHLSGPSSSNVDEHLHSCRLALEQLTDNMDTYQHQLRTLSNMIDDLMPIENQIEQKLTAVEYPNNCQIDLPNLQRLVDKYEQIMFNLNRTSMSNNPLYMKLKNHCQCKFDLYKKILNDLFRKSQSKHVSFDGQINLNNNNSSISQQYLHDSTDNYREKRYRRTETHSTSYDNNQDTFPSNRQSATSSYISDDCKVLYIETVIEVAKPVFYERTSDTLTSTNREYHHQIPSPPPAPISSSNQSTNRYFINTKQQHESSDDDSHRPVNLTRTTTATTTSSSKSQMDSGIEYDQTSQPNSSSSSTIFNQRIHPNDKFLIPSSANNTIVDETSQSIIIHRPFSNSQQKSRNLIEDRVESNLSQSSSSSSSSSYWNRLRQTWLRSLLLGLLILLFLFFVYFSRLDACSRSNLIRTVRRNIICIENEGLPTI